MYSFKWIHLLVFSGLLLLQNAAAGNSAKQPFAISAEESQTNEARDPWLGPDKGLHLIGSMITTIAIAKSRQEFGGSHLTAARNFSVGVVFSLGVAKETWDASKKGNFFSIKDLLADAAGIFLGGLILAIE